MSQTITETDKAVKEIWGILKEVAKSQEETAARFKETDVKFKETDIRFKRTEKLVADLTGKWSKFVEGIIVPNSVKMFKARGIEVEKISTNIKGSKNGVQLEVDILIINGEYAVLIEVKSTLKVKDVDEHIKRIQKFKKVFPEYKDRKIVGAVAGIIIEEASDRYAYHQGLFVIGQTGETAKILNDKKFKPKMW